MAYTPPVRTLVGGTNRCWYRSIDDIVTSLDMRKWIQKLASDQNARAMPRIFLPAFLVTGAVLFLVVPKLESLSAYKYGLQFADGYDLIASNLANGSGYRWNVDMGETMMREPGYPLFLAAVFKVAGHHIEAARSANWLLTIGIVAMIVRLTRFITDDRNTATIAGLLFLFHPGTLIAEARGGVEILFIFAAFLFMVALHEAVEKGKLWRYSVAGLGLGAVVQVRSTPIVFPALLLFYLVFRVYGMREWRRAVLNTAIVGLGMVLVMTPWMIRNYLLVHEFVPVATLQGVALQEGQYTCRKLSPGTDFYVLGREAGRERGDLASRLGLRFEGAEYFQFFYDPHDEWAFNNLLLQEAKDEYINHPGLLAECVGKNLFNFWFLGKTWQITGLNMLIQAPLLGLAVGGFYLLWRRDALRRIGLILTFVVSIVAVHLPIVAEARYSIPVFAFLAIPAAVSIKAIRQKYARRVEERVMA